MFEHINEGLERALCPTPEQQAEDDAQDLKERRLIAACVQLGSNTFGLMANWLHKGHFQGDERNGLIWRAMGWCINDRLQLTEDTICQMLYNNGCHPQHVTREYVREVLSSTSSSFSIQEAIGDLQHRYDNR